MFDSIGFQELVVIGIIALMVVGPKELPQLMRKAGQWTARLRGMAADFRANFDEMARQAELDELRKEVEALRNNNPIREIREELTRPFETGIDPYAPITPYGHEHSAATSLAAPVEPVIEPVIEPPVVTPAASTKPARRKPKAAVAVEAAESPPEKPKRVRSPRAPKQAGADVA